MSACYPFSAHCAVSCRLPPPCLVPKVKYILKLGFWFELPPLPLLGKVPNFAGVLDDIPKAI